MSGFDLDRHLEARRPPLEAALERSVSALEAPVADAAVARAVRHAVLGGGKRLRPLLCVAAWEACRNGGGSAPVAGGTAATAAPPPSAVPESVYDLAASLELVHAYSLVHDDLPCMDDAELRRGRSTTWRLHGEDVAVRAGAALIPGAALQALRAGEALGLDPAARAAVVAVLLEAAGAGGMVGGQWLDLRAEGRALDAADLDRLHRHKTGALLAAALEMGARAAGAAPRVREALLRYGAAVGLAFQVADDILDATADAGVLGKNPSDEALDKSTYVTIHGLEEARGRAAALVAEACQALEEGGITSPPLTSLARFVVHRRN
jgi:geranylgeranyl pyrophosphate synthase